MGDTGLVMELLEAEPEGGQDLKRGRRGKSNHFPSPQFVVSNTERDETSAIETFLFLGLLCVVTSPHPHS